MTKANNNQQEYKCNQIKASLTTLSNNNANNYNQITRYNVLIIRNSEGKLELHALKNGNEFIRLTKKKNTIKPLKEEKDCNTNSTETATTTSIKDDPIIRYISTKKTAKEKHNLYKLIANYHFPYSNVICSGNVHEEEYRRCLVNNLCLYENQFYYFQPSSLVEGEAKGIVSHFHYDIQARSVNDLKKLKMLAGLTGRDEPERSHFLPNVRDQSIDEFIREIEGNGKENGKKKVNIEWIDKKVVLLKKHRCVNSGHCLMETIYPVFVLLSEFFDYNLHHMFHHHHSDGDEEEDYELKQLKENYLIFTENEKYQCECVEELSCGQEGYGAEERTKRCLKMLNGFSKIVSNHPPMLMNDFNKKKESETPKIEGKQEEEQEKTITCFKNTIVGSTPYGLFSKIGWKNVGKIVKDFRDLGLKTYNVTAMPSEERLERRTLKISVYEKNGKNSFLRAKELADKIKQEIPLYHFDLGISNDGSSQKKMIEFQVETRLTNFDNVEIVDQLPLLYDTDIFISPFGAASFNSIWLPTGAVLLSFPNGYLPDQLTWGRVDEHLLFHSYMHYQKFMYYTNSTEVKPRAGTTVSDSDWHWDKMYPLILTSLYHRVKYLISSVQLG
ncbi:hypothetical protein ABK040_004218 [Willaertia magna]